LPVVPPAVILDLMSEVTRILGAIEGGEQHAAEQLLPLVYEELRRLALEKMAHEKPGQTLQATALVHEAYLRLVDTEKARHWDSRGHFFVAAAEAMRRILVENARRKRRIKHGGGLRRIELDDDIPAAVEGPMEDVLAVDLALQELAGQDARTAELVKLHYFAGLTIEQAAEVLGISPRTAYRSWAYARAWLYRSLTRAESPSPD
jgi:RNA polymerase sigma factor (TIGR02999 family)